MDSMVSSYNRHQKDDAFRIYVTDGLYGLLNGTLTYTERFVNLIHPENRKKEVTASDAKNKIKNKLRRN